MVTFLEVRVGMGKQKVKRRRGNDIGVAKMTENPKNHQRGIFIGSHSIRQNPGALKFQKFRRKCRLFTENT